MEPPDRDPELAAGYPAAALLHCFAHARRDIAPRESGIIQCVHMAMCHLSRIAHTPHAISAAVPPPEVTVASRAALGICKSAQESGAPMSSISVTTS